MASPLYRMIPDGKHGSSVTIAGAKVSNIAANTFVDVPLEHASTLANWTNAGKVGASSARPQGAASGEYYVDTTLGYAIVADGMGVWHNPVTGAVV